MARTVLPSGIVLRSGSLRRAVVLVAVVLLLWMLTYINMTFVFHQPPPRDSDQVKTEIIQLSEEYIKRLAQENGDLVGGPFSGRFTAFDLKKTIAVLLDSMLSRISRLELVLNNVTNGSLLHANQSVGAVVGSASSNGAKDAAVAAAAAAAVLGGQNNANGDAVDELTGRSCVLTQEEMHEYPACQSKIMWMRSLWKSDPCYKGYGVDGSDCSIIRYLSEVEGFCPRQSWAVASNVTLVDTRVTYTNVNLELQPLLDLLKDPNERQGYAWIRMRISRMWPRWSEAARNLVEKYASFRSRTKNKILVHLGFLSKQSGWQFAENQFKGGPLGELVQWSDLISTLYILGHELTITSEVEQLVEVVNHVPTAKTPCQSRKELPVEIIYTDIMGLIQFKKKLKSGYGKFSCLFRVVDSFGTEPAFNHRAFAKQNKILTAWGGQELNTQQFFTMFPHSPDNSFMGFVVDRLLNDTDMVKLPKKDIALVYGKVDFMWQGKRAYLDALHERYEIHGTVYKEAGKKLINVPDYVVNHGILDGLEVHRLLQKAKVFVGLGFPYEGPAPLEAIANGAVFLNPSFDPPHSSKNTKFFKGKPTQREITSQHPYAEVFIGPPYVYTLDIKNISHIQAALAAIANNQNYKSYVPYEYTEEGMLQRMQAYIANQKFCSHQTISNSKWPPPDAVTFVLGEAGSSCKDVCWNKQRICEPSYFSRLNTQEAFANLTSCASVTESSNIYYPAVVETSNICTKQAETQLFSCVGQMDSLHRLCPCRDFLPGQTALCVGCER